MLKQLINLTNKQAYKHMTQTLEQALANTKLYTDNRDYTVIRLPTAAVMAAAGIIAEASEPFSALIVDKDEVSLILPTEVWDDFARRLPGHIIAANPYRLITLDIELDFALVGYMARISKALADAGISILPLAAYSRDHILVPMNQFNIAISALEKLKSG
jgi:hypothetical protein